MILTVVHNDELLTLSSHDDLCELSAMDPKDLELRKFEFPYLDFQRSHYDWDPNANLLMV